MSTPKLTLDVVSFEKQMFSGEIAMVTVEGELGEMGIAPGHAQLITTLMPGPLQIKFPDGSEESFFVSGGMMEVQPNCVTVLADSSIRAKDLDEEKALKAKEHAEKALAGRVGDIEHAKAMAELVQALAELRTIQTFRKKMKA